MDDLDINKDLESKLNLDELIEQVSKEYQNLPVKYQNIPESEHVALTVLSSILPKVNSPYGVSLSPDQARTAMSLLREKIMEKYNFAELPATILQQFGKAEDQIDLKRPPAGSFSQDLQ